MFAIAPVSMIGWIILPIGTVIALAVLVKKVRGNNFQYYGLMAVAWTLIAIVFDYVFIVNCFIRRTDTKDGYYLYYVLTFVLPLLVGWRKSAHQSK